MRNRTLRSTDALACWKAASHARQTVTISRGPMPDGVEYSSRTVSPLSPKTARDDDCTHTRGGFAQRAIASPTTRTGCTRDEINSSTFRLVRRTSTRRPVRWTMASAPSSSVAHGPTVSASHTTVRAP